MGLERGLAAPFGSAEALGRRHECQRGTHECVRHKPSGCEDTLDGLLVKRRATLELGFVDE
jgi:hypothetical protein